MRSNGSAVRGKPLKDSSSLLLLICSKFQILSKYIKVRGNNLKCFHPWLSSSWSLSMFAVQWKWKENRWNAKSLFFNLFCFSFWRSAMLISKHMTKESSGCKNLERILRGNCNIRFGFSTALWENVAFQASVTLSCPHAPTLRVFLGGGGSVGCFFPF